MDNSCGFKKASVNRKICLNCGKCVNVCPFIGRQESKKICDGKLLSYKDNDRAVLLRSSSGGIAYRIAYQGIISGLIVQSIVASSGKNFYIQVICMVVIIYKQKDIVKKIFNRLVKKESIK